MSVDSKSTSDSQESAQGQDLITTQAVIETVPTFSFLGDDPKLLKKNGPPFHEELVKRWSNYLREGISVENRNDLIKKFPIPENCVALHSPKMNEEIRTVLSTQIQKNDRFFFNLQEQIGAGLTAIGQILNLKITEPTSDIILDEEKLQTLADAAQLIANTHNAISLKRKFEVHPFLNEESKKASHQSSIDEFLFGSNFLEKLKSCQTIQKAASEIKRQKKNAIPVPGPSGSQHLNSTRPQYKKRLKERRNLSPVNYQGQRKKTRERNGEQPRHWKYSRYQTTRNRK